MKNSLLTLSVILVVFVSFLGFSQEKGPDFWHQYIRSFESKNSDFHPLDQWGLLEQKFSQYRKTKLSKLSLKFSDDKHRYLLNTPFDKTESESQTFKIMYKGKELHHIFLDTKSYVFDGKRLFFVTKNSFIKSKNYTNVFYIDLERFEKIIGAGELPIFRIPVEGELSLLSLDSVTKQVRFAERFSLPGKVLNEYSQSQHLAMQVSANLLDPKTYSGSEIFVKEVVEEFHQAAKRMGQAVGSLELQEPEELKKFIDFVQREQKAGSAKLPKDLALDYEQYKTSAEKLASYQRLNLKNQKLMNRIHWLSLKTIIPNPVSLVKNIRDSLHYLYFYKKYKGNKFVPLKKGVGNSLGLAVAAASSEALLQTQLGISLFDVFSQIITMGANIGQATLGRISDISSVGKFAVEKTFAGLDPHILEDVYISNGMWKKTLMGLGAVTGLIYTTLGVPHLLVNTFSLVRDMKKIAKQKEMTSLQTIKNLKKIFIMRQNQTQIEYEELLAGSKDVSPELQMEADEFLAQLREDNKPLTLKWLEKKSWGKPLAKFLSRRNSLSGPKEMQTFRKAFIHFLFSYSSFTKSGAAYSKIWNAWFGFRSFVTYPKTALKLLFYPRLFKVATRDPFHLVNEYNGGNRPLQEMKLDPMSRIAWSLEHRITSGERFKVKDFANYREVIPKTQKVISNVRKTLNEILSDVTTLKSWEENFLSIESRLIPLVMSSAREMTLEHLLPKEKLKMIYQGGVSKLGEKKLKGLSGKSKRLYFSYYQELFELVKEDLIISRLPERERNETLRDWKLRTSEAIISYEKSDIDIDHVKKIASDSQDKIRALISKKLNTFEQYRKYTEFKLYQRLSPNINTQVKRMNVVSDKVKQPKALARGVKSMIASNIVDKPLELIALFITSAGITEGLMKPIYGEMFSEHSWFFMSKYLFSVGFTYSVLSGVLAHVWMKVQQDELNEGNFDVIPQGKDKKISYTKWFWKQGMLNPGNSFWANQKHYWKIITANLRAALVTSVTLHWFIFQRFDIDIYLLGYLMSYGVMTSGVLWMLDQAFELSAGWFQKDIPEHLRKVPTVNNYIEKKVGKARLKFNFIYKNFENFLGYLIGNFQNASTPEFGDRSLMRILTGGSTLTEIIDRKTAWLSENVPGARYLSDVCNRIFVGKK